jgi:hypothetical protein
MHAEIAAQMKNRLANFSQKKSVGGHPPTLD